MTKAEIASLPKGTTLFVVSRKISKSGMKQVFDIFYTEQQPTYGEGRHIFQINTRWIRIQKEEVKGFRGHASTSCAQDNRVGGTFWVNGCGFSRVDDLVQDLCDFAGLPVNHFHVNSI